MNVQWNINNVAQNPTAQHGLHIHEFGDFRSADGLSTGGHWNPTGANHNCTSDKRTGTSHYGDLGNINFGGGFSSGNRNYYYPENVLTGSNSIVGRALVLHRNPDDCVTQPTGDAGSRLAVCIIGIEGIGIPVSELPGSSNELTTAGAVVNLIGTSNLPGAQGWVEFEPTSNGMRTAFSTDNLTGTHGFHIHEYGDISNAAGTNTGGHYNPTSTAHGIPPFTPRHIGDMGNIFHYEGASAWYHYINDQLQLNGTNNVMGRGVIVHADEDRCLPPTGDAGARLMMGVIGHRNPSIAYTAVPGSVPTTQNIDNCLALDDVYEATCQLEGTSNDAGITGTVTISVHAVSLETTVTVQASGLTRGATSGLHGIHIHTYGDLTLANGGSSGGHWNPTGVAHACPTTVPRHLGDMGNWNFTSGSVSQTKVFTDFATNILDGNMSALGRAIVVHELEDNCTGASGFAGLRLAHCVIGVSNTAENRANSGDDATDGAITKLVGVNSAAGATGTVDYALQAGGVVRTTLTATNITGMHGFHVHAFGDISSPGGHFNPNDAPHALPPRTPRQVGDLGNVYHYDSNVAWYRYDNNYVALSTPGARNNIIGRANVVHQNPDNCNQPTGGGGPYNLVGIIGHRNPDTDFLTVPGGLPTSQNDSACPDTVYEAKCEFAETSANGGAVTGTATLTALPGGYLQVDLSVSGLLVNPNGMHGVHVHQYGDITDPAGSSTGSHWNPSGGSHACPPSATRHWGDLGNFAASGGSISMSKTVGGFWDTVPGSPLAGNRSMIGRAVVIHAGEDCLNPFVPPQTGARIAQCVIGLSGAADNMANQQEDLGSNGAVAVLAGTSNAAGASGRADFEPVSTDVRTALNVAGLSGTAPHGFHVHWYGDLSAATGTATGGHFNPAGVSHALPGFKPRHVGDLGNAYVWNASSSEYWYHYVNDYISVSGGSAANNIVGRGLIFHNDADTCAQPTGAAGSRLLQAVVGIRNPATAYMAVPGSVNTTQDFSACPVFRAHSVLAGTTGADAGITGSVDLWANGADATGWDLTVHVQATGIVTGATADHGVHIHWYGDLTDPAGSSTGSHWNPTGANHSCPPVWPRHWGDLGNFPAVGGVMDHTKTLTGYTSNPLAGSPSAIGRAVVMHAAPDCASGAGARIAQSVIGISNVPGNSAGTDDAASDGAVAMLTGTTNAPTSAGRVDYNPVSSSSAVQVLGTFSSITGTHGFHVHTYGDLSAADGTSAGGHFNPDSNVHAIPPVTPRHVGDFGNIYHYATPGGDATYTYSNTYATIGGSASTNIIGRANVVHRDPDDCTQPTGGAGSRYTVGVIGHRNPATTSQAVVAPGTQNAAACPGGGSGSTTGEPVVDASPALRGGLALLLLQACAALAALLAVTAA